MPAADNRSGVGGDAAVIAESLESPDEFAAIFDRHYKAIRSYLSRRVGRALADELASETSVRAFAGRATYDAAHIDARAWLYGIATNPVRKHERREERRRRAHARAVEPERTGGGLDAVVARVDAAATGPAVAAALGRLQRVDREEPRMNPDVDLELVRALHPQSSSSDEARDRSRTALMRAIAAGDRRGPHSARRHVRLRLTLAPSVALVTAVIILLVVLTSGVTGGTGQPASAAAAILRRAARVATASGGPRQLRPGDYWYVHSRETVNSAVFPSPTGRPGHDLVIVDALTYYDRQDWIGVDKPGYFTSRVVGVKFLSAAARMQWQRDGRPAPLGGGLSSARPVDAFDLPYKQLLALPTNVDALYNVVKGNTADRSAAWQRHEMFTTVGDLLRMDPVPARVRAALYLVAARIPGIRVVGLTHDALGRPALAIALNDTLYGEQAELLFDPRTASLLGETSVVVKPGPKYHVKPGTVRTGSTYLTSGIVRHIGQHPHP